MLFSVFQTCFGISEIFQFIILKLKKPCSKTWAGLCKSEKEIFI